MFSTIEYRIIWIAEECHSIIVVIIYSHFVPIYITTETTFS